LWWLLQERHLGGKLTGQPQVVRVQKGHQFAARYCHPVVASCTDASVGMPYIGQRWSEHLHNLGSRVVRAIVHHDQLPVRVGLRQDGSDRLTYPDSAVKGGDDNADERLWCRRGHNDLDSIS